jgi:cell wall-associated NlpC family hydrolase
VDGGRQIGGLDCWGLVRLVFLEETGIELPSYGEVSALDLSGVSVEVGQGVASDVWGRVADLRPLDVAVMCARVSGQRVPAHCGVMVSDTMLLHIEKTTHSVCVPITHGSVKFRLQPFGFYRHRSLQ